MKLFVGVLVITLIVLSAAILTVAAIRLILRDRDKAGSSGALSSAMLEIDSIFEPSKRHTIESVKDSESKTDEDHSGDDDLT